MAFGILFLALWSYDNQDFLNTMNEQLAQGYSWKQIECRAPDESLPHIAIETPIGNKYVCNKLEK
jgi:hypothetical protein|tara:strand:- start:10123 stop:10317 length:195 start_codon:yes stop_codon:yes gene_type:complete